jgi:hypothetical protein
MNAAREPVKNPEAGPLAHEMVIALRELVVSYQQEEGLAAPEAAARVREDLQERELHALHCQPCEVSWADLEGLLERYPAKFQERWEEIKQAAREEISAGHRASRPVEVYGSTPWHRAQFIALRTELADGWQPRNGIERQLVDMLAQAQTAYEYWLKVLISNAAREAALERAASGAKGTSEQPSVTGFQNVEQAGAMVDRFNRMYMRALRALRDLRRGLQPILVANAGQMNVAQQMNVAPQAGSRNDAAVQPAPDVIGRRIGADLPNGQAAPDAAGRVACRRLSAVGDRT